MKVTVSKHAGFCQGVQRAFNQAEEVAVSAPRPLQMLGDLVHNAEVVRHFTDKGIEVVDSVDKVKDGTLIITAHGVAPQIRQTVQEKGINLVDTTCPFGVRQVHAHAKKLDKAGKRVIIIGKKGHREVIGIMGEVNSPIVITNLSEVENIDLSSDTPIGVVSQTTFKVSRFEKIIDAIKVKFSNVMIIDTICRSAHERQEDIKQLASKNDVAIIIGDPKSSNSTELYNTAKEVNPNSYFIATADQLDSSWFTGHETVCITAGASTPPWVIDKVVKQIRAI